MTKTIEDKVHRKPHEKKHVKTDYYQWELTAEINLPLKKRNSSLSIFVRCRHAIATRPAERLREMNHNKRKAWVMELQWGPTEGWHITTWIRSSFYSSSVCLKVAKSNHDNWLPARKGRIRCVCLFERWLAKTWNENELIVTHRRSNSYSQFNV